MNDASTAAALLAVDPSLGAALRGGPGPARDAFMAALKSALPPGAPMRKIPAGVTDDRLLGGLDLAATLGAGRRVAESGLLAQADGGIVVVAMAERMEPGIAARLAATMDAGEVTAERDGLSHRTATHFGVIALDEGIDEAPPAALMDRLAFQLAPDADPAEPVPPEAVALAREALPGIALAPDSIEALVGACAQLGIASLRAPMLALKAACASAALAGRGTIDEQDLQCAARLVLAPRATQIPGDQPEPPPPPPDNEPDRKDDQKQDDQSGRLADRVLDAASCALPADLLAGLARGAAMRARAGGSAGVVRRNANRGRTIGTRPGSPSGGARLHLLATLRAAAPWQAIRRQDAAAGGIAGPQRAEMDVRPVARIAVRKADFRVRRFHQSTRTTTIFVVDASGSAAVARLAEAKGAVERLLAECYVRRDRVALMSVRGGGAEILLPPTSSLARAKRSLAAMPGGGGTPLAAGFAAAIALAGTIKRGGQTPIAVFMSDGRPNIALSGAPGRPAAEADAMTTAKAWRATGHAALFVDMAIRPHPFARALAEAAAATYLALPQGNGDALQIAVRQAAAS